MRRGLSFVAVPWMLMVGACFDVTVEEAPARCDTSSACPGGQQCDVATRACVPLEEGRFQGRFACDVVGPMGVDDHSLPGSEVMGKLDDAQILLPLGAQCDVNAFGEVVVLFTSIEEPRLGLVVKLPPDAAANGGDVPIVVAKGSYLEVPDGVAISSLQAKRADGASFVLARATEGTLRLDAPATPGTRVRGSLDVRMVPIPPAVAPGLPCPEGVHQCGASVGAMCSAIVYPDAAVCVALCDKDAACPATHRCTDVGACLLRCTSDAACPAPLLCSVMEKVCQ